MEKKIAIVTGASRGIGAACAYRLSQEGFHIGLHFRANREKALLVQKKIPDSELFQYDLSKESDCQKMVDSIKSRYGHVDVLVNNAGISIDKLIWFASLSDFDQLLDLNLKSSFILTKLIAKLMLKKRQGRIINITSIVGHSGNIGQSMYSATKGAITAFSKSVAAELAKSNILVNCVAPGFIETEMTSKLDVKIQEQILSKVPMQRLGTPEEVAHVVSFLASPGASYITGSTIHVNGGMLMV